MKIAFVSASFAFVLAACSSPSEAIQPASSIADRPEREGSSLHVLYLHGNIVQRHGKNAVSPEYGPYMFDEIVVALGRSGANVHAPVRTGNPSNEASAQQVVAFVEELLKSGVSPTHITVVGASQGSIIAMLVSETLKNPALKFVLMGACNDWVRNEINPDLYGHILSIYEVGDPYGASCEPLTANKPGVSSFKEHRLSTGLSHGFLYSPLPAWIEPTLLWSARAVAQATDDEAG